MSHLLLSTILREVITPDDYYNQGDKLMGDIVRLEVQLRKKLPDIEQLNLSARADKSVHVNSIRVKKSGQGKGIGTAVLNAVKKFAAKHRLPVTLSPEPDKGKKAALHRFYSANGFKKCRDSQYTSPFAPTLIWFPT